jgi:hypothetical protein
MAKSLAAHRVAALLDALGPGVQFSTNAHGIRVTHECFRDAHARVFAAAPRAAAGERRRVGGHETVVQPGLATLSITQGDFVVHATLTLPLDSRRNIERAIRARSFFWDIIVHDGDEREAFALSPREFNVATDRLYYASKPA